MTEIKQPKIRFKGYINDWEQCKFSNLLDKKDGIRRGPFGSALKKDFFVQHSEYVVYEQQNAIYDRFDTRYNITKEKYEELIKFKVESGDFIMSGAGTIGKISLVPNGIKQGVFNQALIRLRIDKNLIDSEYFLQLMRSGNIQKMLTNSNSGSAMVNLAPMSEVKNWDVVIPNKEEQSKIGDFFKTLDNAISLHQQKLEVTKQFKKTMLKKMFPKSGETTPEIRFKGFTGDWEQYKVNEIFKVTRGQVLSTTEINEEQSETMPYPVYSSQTKNDGIMGYYKDYLFDTAITWTTDGANAGTVNYRSGKFYSTNVNGVLLSEEGYVNKAIAEILNREAWKWVSHVGNPKLMNNVMGNIVIYIPPSFEEQNILSDFFLQLDEIIISQKRKLEVTKQFKQTMLIKLFI